MAVHLPAAGTGTAAALLLLGYDALTAARAPQPQAYVLPLLEQPRSIGLEKMSTPRGGLFLSDVFAASVAASVAEKALLHPVDTIKTRLQYMRVARPHTANSGKMQSWRAWPVLGDFALLRAQPSADVGMRSLYRGLLPVLVGVVPTALVYMPTYEYSKAAFSGSPLASFAGCITGCVCACVRVPISVVKSRVQLQLYDSPLAALRGAVSDDQSISRSLPAAHLHVHL